MNSVCKVYFLIIVLIGTFACSSSPDAGDGAESGPSHNDADLFYVWERTGGPLGGLGYDIRIRADNPQIMYVTDAFAGSYLSEDAGGSWYPINKGVTTRSGYSGDAIPVFSLTIDPRNPDILWIGTQDKRGIYKSEDSGRSRQEMTDGIEEEVGITFRGFAVDPRSSDTAYAAGEIASWTWAGAERQGVMFDRVRGVVYKTLNGGQSWRAVWRGDNLARYVWINPDNPGTTIIQGPGIAAGSHFPPPGFLLPRTGGEPGNRLWKPIS